MERRPSMMGSTRRSPPMHIFQDPAASMVPMTRVPMGQMQQQPSASPLRAIKNCSSRKNLVFNPPSNGPNKPSPLKALQNSNPPPKAVFNNKITNFNRVTFPPPMQACFPTDSPPKKPAYSTSYGSAIINKPHKALFTTFQSTAAMDKENRVPSGIYSDNFAEYSDPIQVHKGPHKRTLMEAAPIKDRGNKKPKVDEPVSVVIPEPKDMPVIEDDGAKPPYSYATLIGMSILRAPERHLTLAQIYKWISDSFSYYRTPETGWQNSIRHNLSLNKAFAKKERPKDEPGKGNYWIIVPGMEGQFIKDKQARRPAAVNVSSSAAPVPAAPAITIMPLPKVGPVSDTASIAKKVIPTVKLGPHDPFELLSSDATWPASDAGILDDKPAEKLNLQSQALQCFGSPHLEINSSPPMVGTPHVLAATPPAAPQLLPVSSHPRSLKRKAVAMEDSGYYSSLDSSGFKFGDGVTSPIHSNLNNGIAPSFLEADTDKPRSKRGRAEEEIARIRRSSKDSPSKPGSAMKHPQSSQLVSSSPVRVFDGSFLAPLTPATTFRMPIQAPPSLSPSTKLYNHREYIRQMRGSPAHGAMGIFNPNNRDLNFNIGETPFDPNENFNNTFYDQYELFVNWDAEVESTVANGSPEKRSAKKARIKI